MIYDHTDEDEELIDDDMKVPPKSKRALMPIERLLTPVEDDDDA